jgi:hypothetical protein
LVSLFNNFAGGPNGGSLRLFISLGDRGVLAERIFSRFALPRERAWRPQRLAWTALSAAWDEGSTATLRFEHAAAASAGLHRHWSLGGTYAGYVRALAAASPGLLPAIVRRFQRTMGERFGSSGRTDGWWPVAADGSRVEAPRTVANTEVLGCAGREKSGPQVSVAALWHLTLGVPWDYRVGAGIESERALVDDMLAALPARSLFIADAGFASYALCRRLQEAGHGFLLRIGRNVRLLKKLGYARREGADTVYLWPDRERLQGREPLVLRLVVRRRGKRAMYLLTNLNARQLSPARADHWYRRRWGVETFFRTYKQTLQRRKLLSRTPEHALVECRWTVAAVWLLGLVCLARKPAAEQTDWSPAQARDAVRRALRPAPSRRPAFQAALRRARPDRYVRRRPKRSRDYPRKKRESPPRKPKIKTPTRTQINTAKRLRVTIQPTT